MPAGFPAIGPAKNDIVNVRFSLIMNDSGKPAGIVG